MNSVSAANKSRLSDNVLAESLMVCPIKKQQQKQFLRTFFSRKFTLVLLTKDALNLS